MKKVVVVAPYFPPHAGGMERYAREIAVRICREFGWAVTVITTGERGSRDTLEEADGLRIYRLGYSFKISNTPFAFRWLWVVRRILKNEAPHVVHIHMPVPGLPDIAALSTDAPSIITYHGLSMKKGRFAADAAIGLYERFVLPFILARARYVVAGSDAVRSFISAAAEVITPGVSREEFRTERRAGGKRILFVASDLSAACEYKGLPVLIRALSIVRRRHPDVSLSVIGDGDRRREYERQARERRIDAHFCGRVSGKALSDAYAQANVFVLPTSNDSHPTVILEAMASGLPIVSTPVGSIPAMVAQGKNGFLVKPNDAEELALRLIEVLDDPKLARSFAKHSLRRVEAAYEWSTRARRYDAIYADVSRRPVVQVIAWYPPRLGGMERVAALYKRGLAERGWNARVITSRTPGAFFEPGVTRLRGFPALNSFIAPMLLWHLLRSDKRAIVHLHLAQGYWPEMVLMAARLRGLEYVVHFHLDVQPSGRFGFLFPAYKRLTWGPVLRRASRVLVCSEGQIPIVARYGVDREKIFVMPNAVGGIFFQPREYAPSEDVFRLLYVGRLAPQKRVERLIDMMKKLRVPAFLSIVGDGEDAAGLKTRAKRTGLANIRFHGALPAERVCELLRHYDAFVIASDQEGAPLCVIEAFASGLPVVASDVLGNRELVADAGVLVPEPYVKNFARALEALWRDKRHLYALSRKAREKASAHTETRVISELEAHYRSL